MAAPSSLHTQRSFPASISAWDLLQQTTATTTAPHQHAQLHLLDDPDEDWLRLHPGLYELAGPGGSGKTQMALHLCLRAAVSSFTETETDPTNKDHNNNDNNYDTDRISPRSVTLNDFADTASPPQQQPQQQPTTTASQPHCRAVYLCLGDHNHKRLQRLSQMAALASPEHHEQLMNRIATRRVVNSDDWFHEVLHQQLPQLLQQSAFSIRVVVVDALADLFRHHNDSNNHATRAAHVCAAAQRLQQLAHQHQTRVVVLNQVSGHDQQPALGLAWAHCVNASFLTTQSMTISTTTTRTRTTNTKAKSEEPPEPTRRRRTLVLRHSSRHASGQEIEFFIDQKGVHPISSNRKTST